MSVPIFLIIFGYNISNSYIRRGYDTFKKLYDFEYFSGKFERLCIPLFFWVILMRFFGINLLQTGMGMYYIYVILQLLFLMPLIYMVVKKFVPNFCGVFLCFVVGVLWDVIISEKIFPISIDVYKYYCFRYLFYSAIGVYFALNKSRIKPRWLISSFVLGILYLANTHIPDRMLYPWTMGNWALTASPAGFYLFSIMYLMLTYMHDFKIPGVAGSLFETIGKASWHIYIMQMVYFSVYSNNWILNVIACCVSGLIFYEASNIISSRLKKY